jgi:3'(2'), 5'-bisphosphate nucleotidase
MTPDDLAALLESVSTIALDAGQVVMEVYNSDFAVNAKDDKSPVTEADVRAERLILERLQALTPDIPIISEEASAAGHQPKVGDVFWLVDPLDGTKEFIRRNGEFTVNIGLIRDGQPVLGVVHAPAIGQSYRGAGAATAQRKQGDGDWTRIRCRRQPEEGLTVLTSRSHGSGAQLDGWLAEHKIAGQVTAGSSLKFCVVAAGEADAYPRFGNTCEWDTAAAHAVLLAAGGSVVEAEDGLPLSYGKTNFLNPFFIAWGRR